MAHNYTVCCPICDIFPCQCRLENGKIVIGAAHGQSTERKVRKTKTHPDSWAEATGTTSERGQGHSATASVPPLSLSVQQRTQPPLHVPARTEGTIREVLGHKEDCPVSAREFMTDETGYCAWCDKYVPIPATDYTYLMDEE